MPRGHTHYDNLKVTRNAPPEVIRAAYKSLSQKFHPDRNPDDPNATRTFQIINTAYEVLSDPLKRREHDDWIASVESEQEPPQSPSKPTGFSSYPGGAQHAAGVEGNGFGAQGFTAQRGKPAVHAGSSHFDGAGLRARVRSWPHSIRRFRSGSKIRQASGYLFLTAVATLVMLGIILG